jgi:hypothetical protein
MVKSFSELRKQNKNFSEMREKMKAQAGGKKSYTDDRFWQADLDKAGNGEAVIRFLPPVQGEDTPYTPALYKHAFQGPSGKWVFENCPATIGKPCPVCEMNDKLWNSGSEADKKIVQGIQSKNKAERKAGSKRTLSYVMNVLVIDDPANPANNGKVFLFKFGKKLFEKILDAVDPKFKTEEPFAPWDFWEGANFNLRMYRADGFTQFDKCQFDKPTALFDGDEDKLKAVWEKQYPLKEFYEEAAFNSYEKIKERVDLAFGNFSGGSSNVEDDMESEGSIDEELAELKKTLPQETTKDVVEEDNTDAEEVEELGKLDDMDDLDALKKFIE